MGAGHHSRARRLSFLAVVFLFGVVMLAQANVKNASIAQIRLHEMSWPSVRLERENPCRQGVSFESQARLSLEMPIGIFCGGDPVNYSDPDGRCANPSQQNGVSAANIFGANGGDVNVNALLQWGMQNPNAKIAGTDNASGWMAAGQAMANGTMPNPQYINGYTDQLGHSYQTFCYSCHDPNDAMAQLKLGAAYNTVNSSWGAFIAQNALAFVPAEGMIGDAAPVLNALTQGVDYEAQRLAALNLPKNTTVFQPTPQQVQSAAFQVIVGPAQYTAGGDLVGTISDSAAGGGLLEIKGGSSTLNSSYQLRLQTYNSVVNNVPLTIETTRPVNPTFMNYLQNWGVTVKPPGTP